MKEQAFHNKSMVYDNKYDFFFNYQILKKNVFGLNYWDIVQNEMTILTDMLFTICVNEMQFNSNRY